MKYITSTIVRATDIALNDNLFGVTLLKWCDEYGGLFCYKYLHHTFVTYKMGNTYFLKSAKIGTLIDFYITNLKFNKISVTFDIVAMTEDGKEILKTAITFVAIDRDTEKATMLNPMKFEKQEFESFVKQRINLPDGVKCPKISITKTPDLTIYKNKYIAELYMQTYQNLAQAIATFQRDYGKLMSSSQITEVIKIMNTPTVEEPVQ